MTTPCPYCPKSFKNLNSHIVKTHTKYECRITIVNDDDKMMSLFEIKNGVEKQIGDQSNASGFGNQEYEYDGFHFNVDDTDAILVFVDVATGLVREMTYEYYSKKTEVCTRKPIASRRFKTITSATSHTA